MSIIALNRIRSRKNRSLKPAEHGSKKASSTHASGPLLAQQAIGNQAVQRMLQAKLTVNPPGDEQEKEADQSADTVMRMPVPGMPTSEPEKDDEGKRLQTKPLPGQNQHLIQRVETEKEEDEEKKPLQTKPLSGQDALIQREVVSEDEEKKKKDEETPIQTKALSGQSPLLIQREANAGTEGEQEKKEDEEKPLQTKLLSLQASVSPKKQPPVQMPGVTEDVESHIAASKGGGEPLPESARAFAEPRFSQDFSRVRVHSDAQSNQAARALNAQAFTTGQDIYFGAGSYQVGTMHGNRLLSHELTHVVQQGDALSSGGGDSTQMKSDASADETADAAESSGEELLSSAEDNETQAVAAQLKVAAKLIQASQMQGPIQRQAKKKTTYVPYQIHVTKPMTQEEFRVAAMIQIFGGVLKNTEWRNSKDSYVPANSPYTVLIDTQLLKQQRGEANKERGISVEEGGSVTGAEERAKTFHVGPESDEKSALMQEIDRRYFEAAGDKTGTRIKAGEKGKAEHWRMIRDEVLFQHEYIANLPPKVKELIKFSIKGRDLTPADYDKLFAIAKKIEKMPVGQVSDYASKVTGTTTDLNQFEASLESYSTEMAKRQKGTEAHKDTMTKLGGLEQVYEKYKTWVRNEAIAPGANQKEQAELEKLIKAHDFAGIPEFTQYIDKFLNGFETESAGIIQDLLAKYEGRLYREGERYKNPKEVSALHGKLGGYRSNLDVMKQSEDVMQVEYAKQRDARERSRLPGHGGTTPEPTEAFKAARKKGEGAREAAKGELRNLASEHPIFQDDEALPVDRRINKIALHTATETSLQGVLLGFIAQRKDAVKDARGELAGNSELIWKMDKMIPQFMLQQGIVDGSIHAQIIQDKMREDRIKKIVMGILAAIAAIALTVVSLGTATPAIVAAGAAAGAFGISAYMGYEEVKNYAQDKKLAEVGLVDDPSIIWVVVAIAGAALDAGAAVKAIRAIAPLARAVNTGGDLMTFTKAVRTLEEAGEIDAKIARAAERAAAAKKGYQEASSEFDKAWGAWRGRMASGGPYTDPDVYKALVKMAAAKFKEIGNNGVIFIEEIKKARALAKLPEMTPEELAKVKQAWAEGKALGAAEKSHLEKLDARIAELEAKLNPARQRTLGYQAGRKAEGKSLKGGPIKEIWNIKERIWILKRQQAFPDRTILEQAEVVGVKMSDGTIKSTTNIAGKGRIPDFVEIRGSQTVAGDLKSAEEMKKSIAGGLKKSTKIEGEFKASSKVGGQHQVEQKVLEEARKKDGKIVIEGRNVLTGEIQRIEVNPSNYSSEVISYEDVFPN